MSPVRDGGIDGDDDDIADTVLETVAVIGGGVGIGGDSDGGDDVGVGGDSGDDVGVDDGDRGADDAAFGDERSGSFDNDSDQDLSDTDYEPFTDNECLDSLEQSAMYSGYKRIHAVKYQAVTTPDGMIAHLFGPAEGRSHDLTLLEASDLEETIKNDHRFDGYLIYEDPAYGQTDVFASPF
ncbi:hypothetical protein PPTG_14456 [Phytophthora nicotianae INRA-310]|uniref:DDE Tnp4 domain-containing protein n=1 Tax=Phytophthora nicotianae (strain INRA-310) TaxID=761204 RepID=W2PWI5_PHYN3|nr:hypothetical protein PPTG_14456 [Phytophthora nicotianae INRA-310]ETN04624.1 hypothetical protein PPTG_14456 [Phytophthora nicotianae INRA-310]